MKTNQESKKDAAPKFKREFKLKPLEERLIEARAHVHNAHQVQFGPERREWPEAVQQRYYVQMASVLCYELDRKP